MSDYAALYPEVPKDLARMVLRYQATYNASNLVYSLSEAMPRLLEQARKQGQGTAWINKHPVVVLISTRLSYLSGSRSIERLKEAVEVCKRPYGSKSSET